MYLLDTVFKDLRAIMQSIVVKYDKEAKKYETVDSMRESDRYLSAMTLVDSFNTYQTFSYDAIFNAGIHDEETIKTYIADKYSIPRNIRDKIVEQQRKIIVSNYVEKNNYYRMLAGLPDYEDVNFIYVDPDVCADIGINPATPIHLLTSEEVAKLDKVNYLQKVIVQYPAKEYLTYLGINKIDIVRARSAGGFSLLRVTKNVSETFYEDFNNIYEQCREYYMTVIYNTGYAKDYDYYDNFIALMIMVMTIQRLIVSTFKYGIERDFYDLGSIQMLFSVYNIPFIQSLPMDYQRILVRNLNNLLRYKSTDKVLYDICSLLGFDRIKLFKYFLVKEHRLDVDENPVFIYKEVENDDGSKSLVEDPEQMYRLYFQSVELKERNTALALGNSTTKMDYSQVVVEDPYWWDDDDDMKKLIYESEFNYVETKFLSMNIMYKLTEMLFEVIYVFRMLMDKKSEIANITLELPKLFDRKKLYLFDIVAFLCALISKKNGMAGNIIATPSKSLSILGFNFKTDFDVLKKYIRDNSDKLDQQILKYIEDVRIYGPQDVNKLFVNIRALNDFIVAKMAASQDIDEYRAYKKIFTTLMVTEHTEALFTKTDGTIAQTFAEYFEDRDIAISNFIRNVHIDEISGCIDHILTVLNGFMTDLKYLYILNDANNVVLNAITTLTAFFKSYTTDLTSFNILYLMDSRYYNLIKMIHHVQHIEKNMHAVDTSMLQSYRDTWSYTTHLSKEEILQTLHTFGLFGNIDTHETQKWVEKITSSSSDIMHKVLYLMKEKPGILHESIIKNYYSLDDKLFIASYYHRNERVDFNEQIQYVAKILGVNDSINFNYSDLLSAINKMDQVKDQMTMTDKITLIREI